MYMSKKLVQKTRKPKYMVGVIYRKGYEHEGYIVQIFDANAVIHSGMQRKIWYGGKYLNDVLEWQIAFNLREAKKIRNKLGKKYIPDWDSSLEKNEDFVRKED